ncbi:MAG: MFS transporter [Planctomycetes bacterium RBG_13_63_9]|nr:MAG: MFS transporter [Planctomycetes bacterium RBG_13_63_9]
MPKSADERGGSVTYVCVLATVAALGGLLFGYDTAVIAGAIKYLVKRFELSPVLEGWAVSNVLVGCMIGAALAGTLSDRFGRKRVLLLSAVLFAVSAICSALPRDLTQFVIARMLGGFAVGMASMLSPLYIAEVSPARIRGRLVSLNQITIITGMLVVSIVNWMIASPDNEPWNVAFGWRWMFASEALPASLFLLLLLLVPESPRWLTKQGRESEALAILTRVAGASQARREMKEIHDAIAEEGGSIRELFRPGIRVALMIAIALAILQQVTGINAVLYYAPKIFESAKVTATQALLQTVALHAMNLLLTLVAVWVVDRRGRKPLLLITSAAMGVSLVLLGGAFHWGLSAPWIFGFTLAYVGSFAIAMGPVVWVVLSEIFPTRIRGRAMGVATVCLWVACFAVSQTVPWMFDRLGQPATFWTYAAMCVVSLVFVALFVPETKGKTLEEIERSWMR